MRTGLLILTFAVGCAGSPETPDTVLAGVQIVNRDYLEQGHWYMDISVSDAPVLASEVADRENAYPVDVLVAYDFVAAVANRQVVASWAIEGVEPNTHLDEVVPAQEEEQNLVTPPRGSWLLDPSSPLGANVVPSEFIVNWSARGFGLSPGDLEQLQVIHPGCV
jgi:hypothetical protein